MPKTSTPTVGFVRNHPELNIFGALGGIVKFAFSGSLRFEEGEKVANTCRSGEIGEVLWCARGIYPEAAEFVWILYLVAFVLRNAGCVDANPR